VDARTREPKTEIIGHDDGQHLRPTWPLTLVIAVAVALAAVLGPVRLSAVRTVDRLIAGFATAGDARDAHAWALDLPAQARAAAQVDLAEIRPAADPLVHRLAGMISFDDRTAQCPPPAASCASPRSGVDGRWGIHLDAQTTAFTVPSNRFLVYHEIGHAVWALQLGPAHRRAFAEDVRRALDGRPCVNDQGRPCGALTEMFADEFARFAGGFAASMSYYCTPPLLDAATFGGLVGATPTTRPRPSPAYVERPAYVAGKIVLIKVRTDAPNVREDRGITPDGDFR
jgi:hypothetical protein